MVHLLRDKQIEQKLSFLQCMGLPGLYPRQLGEKSGQSTPIILPISVFFDHCGFYFFKYVRYIPSYLSHGTLRYLHCVVGDPDHGFRSSRQRKSWPWCLIRRTYLHANTMVKRSRLIAVLKEHDLAELCHIMLAAIFCVVAPR